MHARPRSNAALAGGLNQLGLAAFLRRHAANNAFFAANVFFGAVHVHLAGLGRHLAGQLVHERAQATHALHLAQLLQKVVEVKALAALDLGRQLLCFGHVHIGRHLLHQGHNVAHAQHAVGMAVGVKQLNTIELFAHAHILNGRTRDRAHRQRRTATRITIGFGQHNARER